MHIASVRLINYKSFLDSGEIVISPGFNIIIGQNNVGKSAFLEMLSFYGSQNPHKSLKTLPLKNSQIDLDCRLQIKYKISAEDVTHLKPYFKSFFVPHYQNNFQATVDFFDKFISNGFILFSEYRNSSMESATIEGWPSGDTFVKFIYDKAEMKFTAQNASYSKQNVSETFPFQLSGILQNRIYAFKAERLNIGPQPISENKLLAPNASNLAQVLNNLLSSDPYTFQLYKKLVSEVLPQVRSITAPPNQNGQIEIKIWPIKEDTRREDLSVLLSNCGTGVSQVLAILYVIVVSEHPQFIMIDEPQSFLHPGAAKKLIEILKQHSHHQYILSTHSPSIITSTNPNNILRITQNNGESNVESLDVNDIINLRLILEDVGASLSDVFGSDAIIWVEGATEEICYKKFISLLNPSDFLGIDIIGLRNTGDLEGKQAKAAFEIYRKLSTGRGILPPALGFILDKEGKTDKDVEDLIRQSKGEMNFIPRRMFENYLINPEGISNLINELLNGMQINHVEVNQWILDHGLEYIMKTQAVAVYDSFWLSDVDGAKLLADLFQKLTESRLEYRKVQHGVRLTELILENHSSNFNEIIEIMHRIIQRKPALKT